METTQKIIRIDGKNINATEQDVPHNNLKYYPENPRIKSIIEAEFGGSPSQQQIESKMKSLEHVKELRRSIIANGGLLEPIIVKGNVVLEGNSRLAAYRMLSESDPIKWGNIRAIVLPDNVTEDQIFSMLGTLHIVGKTPWSPYEQAAYLKRRIASSRKPIEAIADELGIKKSSAVTYIETLELMLDNNDTEPSKWSYYHELKKNGSISKADKNYPQLNINDTIVERIKNNEYNDAQEIRLVGKIMGGSGETAQEAIIGYIEGDLSLQEGVELVESASKMSNILTKISAITHTLIKEKETIISNLPSDPSLKFNLQNLRQQINNLINE